ncbi:MAG: hypothetical protein QNJ72_30390 [Pleurocapsa sp. MO_226.B13]|nr:hypothetical protein [Pleurocapsa sp. MO_226.B13]
MSELLILRLLRSGFWSILLLFPLYYLLGYSTLRVVTSLLHAVTNRSYSFKFEDVLVTSLATLSLLLRGTPKDLGSTVLIAVSYICIDVE